MFLRTSIALLCTLMLASQTYSIVIFCKPTIEISNSPNEAHYICKGPGTPPKHSHTSISIADESHQRQNKVTKFTAVNQKLNAIPSALFDTYKNLQVVKLSNAKIRNLVQSNFKYANNLQKLTVEDNNIAELGYQVFIFAPNLVTLKLQKNGIKFVNKNAFANLNHIKEINLNYNEIFMMHTNTFKSLKTLTFVGLLDNSCISGEYNSLQQLEREFSRTSCNDNYADSELYFQIYKKIK